METFLQQHARDVIGVLSGFDRLVFRATIRQLAYVDGMLTYLATLKVRLTEFKAHAEALTEQLKAAVTGMVTRQGRPVIYLPSSKTDKEQMARAIAARDDVRQGTICLLTSVEPCESFHIYRDKQRQRLELRAYRSKCLFLYHYLLHPVFGFMHARIQSWFPFSVQVGINGREWLARQLDRAQLPYVRRENCFAAVADLARAQALLAAQCRVHWPRLLGQIAAALNPAHPQMFRHFRAPYYWSTYQSEWATDVLFRDPQRLARLYPRLIDHGMRSFGSSDVLRFLGRKVPAHGAVHASFPGQIVTDLKRRPEGVRIKHRVNANSIKMYDKQGTVLRIETTINDPTDFKVFRPVEGAPERGCAWLPMRQGIADLYRRTVVAQAANERYVQALAAVSDATPLREHLQRLTRPTTLAGQRVRGLRPWAADDLAVLQAIQRGEFTLNGLRNRDLCRLLYPTSATSPAERRRRVARITRQLRLLRAHGLLRKVPHTHRYQVTDRGRFIIAAILAAHQASTEQLMKLAA